MDHSLRPQAEELHTILKSLERHLARLDKVGAGLAAVHLNAAIDQLYGNLNTLKDMEIIEYDPDLPCLLPAVLSQ